MQQSLNHQKDKRIRSGCKSNGIIISMVFIAITFLLFFMYYFKVSPIVPLDTDDWYYMGYYRYPVPLWGNWNPSRVLPEIMMPNVSIFAALVVYPILGDYISSMTFTYAAVMALLLTITLYSLYKVFFKYSTNRVFSLLLIIFWTAIHFTIMVKGSTGNFWLWRSGSANCYFFYTIPALLNESIVLYCMYHENQYSRFSLFILLILGYFGIFSNLFPAIILAAYGGVQLLFAFVYAIKTKFNDKKILKNQFYHIYVVVLFFISAIFELSGGRASGYPGFRFAATFQHLTNCVSNFNKISVLSIVVLLLVSVIVFRGKNNEQSEKPETIIVLGMLLCFGIVLVFEILLCAKSDASYIIRDDVQIAILFYLLLAVLIFAATVYSKALETQLLFAGTAVAIVINGFVLLGYNHDFYAPTNRAGLSPEMCKKIDEDIVSQVVTAADHQQWDVIVDVPSFNSADNWPIANYAGGRGYISYSLWRHGLISYPIFVQIHPTESKNSELGF